MISDRTNILCWFLTKVIRYLSVFVAFQLFNLPAIGQDIKLLSVTPERVVISFAPSSTVGELKVYRSTSEADKAEGSEGGQGMIGEWTIFDSTATFKPVFPFPDGITYLITDHKSYKENFEIIGGVKTNFEVKSVYPWSTAIPPNLLKVHVTFSYPVDPVRIYDHFYFKNKEGEIVENMILPLQTPIISEDGKTVTLWIEPGRQKRELGPNAELGPAFKSGQSIKLHIDENLRSRQGVALKETYVKNFGINTEDRTKPNPKAWNITPPSSSGISPLMVEFGEVMDYTSTMRAITLMKSDSNIPTDLRFQDRSVLVFPEKGSWKSGDYTLIIHHTLEDLAGNTSLRLFDEDLENPSPEMEGIGEFTVFDFKIK